MTTTKKTLLAAAVLAALGASTPVWAASIPFTFDPTGTAGSSGDISNVSIIDEAPGNALGVGAVTAVKNFLSGIGSKDFTLLYQANLGTLQDEDTNILFANGSLLSGSNRYFTVVAGFGETVLSASGVPGSATFGFNPSSTTNFFKIYANTTGIGNNLTGAGFTAGTIILEGVIDSVQSSGFNLTDPDPSTPGIQTEELDQVGAENWSFTQTVVGSGSTDLTIKVNSSTLNLDYFPDFTATDIIFSFLNTSQVDPFKSVNPSYAFSNDGITSGNQVVTTDGGVTSTLGVNGISGSDFIFQADANQSLLVPEPATLALMGLGLVGMGFASRRRRT